MRGPDHYLAGEQHIRYAEDLRRTGNEDELAAGQLAAAIAQAHFAAAGAAALAEDTFAVHFGDGEVDEEPYPLVRAVVEAAQRWEQVLVDDPDPELEGHMPGDGEAS